MGAEDGTSWFVAAAIGGCGYFQLMGKVVWQILGEMKEGILFPLGGLRPGLMEMNLVWFHLIFGAIISSHQWPLRRGTYLQLCSQLGVSQSRCFPIYKPPRRKGSSASQTFGFTVFNSDVVWGWKSPSGRTLQSEAESVCLLSINALRSFLAMYLEKI